MSRTVGCAWVAFVLAATLWLASCGGGAPNVPPAITIDEPAGAAVVALGNVVVVVYRDRDPDDVASTTLFADRDGDPATTADQVVVANGRPDGDGAVQSVAWNTTGIPGGVYHVFGRTHDGHAQAEAVAPGTVFVNPPPSLALLAPSADTLADPAAGEGDDPAVLIRYVSDDFEAETEVALYADEDGDLGTVADRTPIAAPKPHGHGLETLERWTPDALDVGAHTIVAIADDGVNPPVVVTAPGRARVVGPLDLSVDGTIGAVAAFGDGAFVVAGNEAETGHIFVARYDADGALEWTRTATPGQLTAPTSIAALPDGSCVVAGQNLRDPMTFGTGEDAVVLEPGGAASASFLACYDRDGSLRWARRLGGYFVTAYEVAPDPRGGCFVAGTMAKSVVLGADAPGGGFQWLSTDIADPFATNGVFVASYDGAGFPRWARFATTSGEARVHIAALPEGGCAVGGVWQYRLYLAGEAWEGMPAALRMFLACYRDDGSLAWRRVGQDVGSHSIEDVAGIPGGAVAAQLLTGGEAYFGVGEANEQQIPWGLNLVRFAGDGTLEGATPLPLEVKGHLSSTNDGSTRNVGTFLDAVTVDGVDWPACEPGKRSVLFTSHAADGSLTDAHVEGCEVPFVRGVAQLRDGGRMVLFSDGTIRRYPRAP